MKKCSKCLVDLPLSSFHLKREKNKIGFQGHCKNCNREMTRAYNEKLKARRKAFMMTRKVQS